MQNSFACLRVGGGNSLTGTRGNLICGVRTERIFPVSSSNNVKLACLL